ncbi:lysophosphatidylserine lipase ABHD12-like isoform X2 [Atheta coriaria]
MPEKCSSSLDIIERATNHGLQEHQRIIRLISIYIIITVIGLACIAMIIAFILLPIIFAHWVYIQRLAMFTNVGLPSDRNYYKKLDEHPTVLFRNFYIDFTDRSNLSISLGVWHFVAFPSYPNETVFPSQFDYDQSLKNNTADVVIYFHGSGESRKDPLMMYNVLLRFFHVVAFDYRDYADSTPAILSEKDVAEDAIHVFEWVRSLTSKRIYVWGHSLGTPLSTLTINGLPEKLLPHGLILEAPMTSMDEEISEHPYGRVFAWLPWFDQTIRHPLKMNGFLFATDEYILNVTCPIMILHAEDDSIIPYTLGKKLAKIAREYRPKDVGNVTYVQFDAKYKFDHFRIWQSKRLLTFIPNFTLICDEYYNKTHVIPRGSTTIKV